MILSTDDFVSLHVLWTYPRQIAIPELRPRLCRRAAADRLHDIAKSLHLPLLHLGIRRWIAEHVDEQSWDELTGVVLGLFAQMADTISALEDVDDAALLFYWGNWNSQPL